MELTLTLPGLYSTNFKSALTGGSRSRIPATAMDADTSAATSRLGTRRRSEYMKFAPLRQPCMALERLTTGLLIAGIRF